MVISAVFVTNITISAVFDLKMWPIFDQKTCFLAVFDSKNWLFWSKNSGKLGFQSENVEKAGFLIEKKQLNTAQKIR